MKFCIITNVPLASLNGISRYILNLLKIFKLKEDVVYNVFSLTDTEIEYINANFDFVSIQIGVLGTMNGEGFKIQKLKKIKLKKIATIHSVPDEEVKYLKDCLSFYFPTSTYRSENLYSDRYERFFLKLLDGIIFYTETDRKIFKEYFTVNIPTTVINPSIDYIRKNIYSNEIMVNNRLAYLGRVDYRKGLLCSLNSMEFLKDKILNVYGPVDKNQQYNKVILQHFLGKRTNIKHYSSVTDRSKYYNTHFIFLGNSLYEPFGFSHVENLLNNVVPIIGKSTGTQEVFGIDYPFAVGDSVPDLVNTVQAIYKSTPEALTSVLDKVKMRLNTLTDSSFKDSYLKFCNNIVNR